MMRIFFLVLTMALFFQGGSSAAEDKQVVPAMSFVKESTYVSKRAYGQSANRPFIITGPRTLDFFDKAGRLVRQVQLGRDRKGYVRKSLLNQAGDVLSVVIKSTRGYESGQDWIEFMGPRGERLGEVAAPSLAYAVSPKGDFFISARSHPQYQYQYTSDMPMYSSSGDLIAELQAPFIPLNPRFMFSKEGNYGAALLYSNPQPELKGAVVIFSSNGVISGTFTSPNWSPQAGALDNPAARPTVPLTRLDEQNRVVVSAGHDLLLKRRVVNGIDFDGRLLWRWHRQDVPACPTTLTLKNAKKTVVIIDFCPKHISLYEMNSHSGRDIRERKIPFEVGTPTDVFTSAAPDGDNILVNMSATTPHGLKSTILLLDKDLRIRWKESPAAPSNARARFAPSGSVVIERGANVEVGKFE